MTLSFCNVWKKFGIYGGGVEAWNEMEQGNFIRNYTSGMRRSDDLRRCGANGQVSNVIVGSRWLVIPPSTLVAFQMV